MQLLYIILIGLSAGVITFAVLALVQFIYPSMKLFFPNQSGLLPYGAAMSIVVLLFLLASYLPPLVVLAGFMLLLVMAYGAIHPLPPTTLPTVAFLVTVMALLGEAARIKASGLDPMMIGVLATYLIAPVLACFTFRDAMDSKPLVFTAFMMFVAAIIGPVMTGSMTHGTASAAVVVSAVIGLLVQQHRKAGSIGAAGLVPASLAASHAALTLTHAGQEMVALGLQGVLIAGYAVLAGMRK